MSTGRNGDVSKGGGVGVDPEATSATPLASVIDVPDGHELTTAGQMIFLGDSDVSRWPSSLYPIIPSGPRVVNYGISGARLVDLLQQTAHWKAQNEDPRDGNCLFICCAGENDIGSGIPMERIFEAFRTILDAIFPTINPDQRHDSRMIFFGPKFEPWLTDDHASRKKYARLNNGLQRTIRKHHAFDRVIYVDCLTLFCTKETASEPGAVYGGKGIPDVQYFDSDGLHLNDAGYSVWKRIIESNIRHNLRLFLGE